MKNLFTLIFNLLFVLVIANAQNPFGNGSDGALIVNEGETVTINLERTAVRGFNAAGASGIFVDSTGGIQAGDEIMIITMQDPDTDLNLNNVGSWEVNNVVVADGDVLYLGTSLQLEQNAETNVIQVVKIPNYTQANISGTLTCPEWDGASGGVLFFRSQGNLNVFATGMVTASGKGYRGGTQYGISHGGGQGGESFVGEGGYGGDYTSDPHGKIGAGGGGAAYNGYNGGNALAGGGGGATNGSIGLGSAGLGGAGGGGGGHAGNAGGAGYGTFGFGGNSYGNSNNGLNGGDNISGNGGSNGTGGGGGGGGTYGSAQLSNLYFGSGGGSGGSHNGYIPGAGGNGGGLLYLAALDISNEGIIESNGANGGNGGSYCGGGGGAAGGSLLLKAMTIDIAGQVDALGGTGGNGYNGYTAGNGGSGRIKVTTSDLANTGTITPEPYQASLENIFHTPIDNTANTAGPYAVVADIFDNEGDPITSAKIFYRVDGGSFVQVNLSESKSIQNFTGNIPGQSIGSFIEYYITATDGTDNYSAPISAPANLFSFSVMVFPPYAFATDNNDGTVSINWYPPVNLTNLTNYNVYRSEQSGFIPGASNLLAENLNDTTILDNTVADFHTYYYKVSAKYNYGGNLLAALSNQTEELLVNNTDQTTVLGYAFLEDRNNHANIKVNFVPDSPSAVADSIYTDALGYFETHDLYPGVYSIRMSKPGFQTPIIHEGLSIVEDTDMGETFLFDMGTEVSGDVSGVWSEFVSVTGNITVPAGDSLIIEEGTLVRFLGQYHFYVYGYLACNGAEGAEVLITSGPANQVQARNQWHGMDFYNTSDDNSYLHYTTVEYAYDGIYLEWCSPTIENSLVQQHSHYGIYMHQSDANLSSTTVQNISDRGIHLNYASPMIDNCEIMYCTNHDLNLNNYSNPTISSCTISNSNYGIYAASNSNPTVDGCTISNIATDGIYFTSIWGRGLITNNTFINNNKGIFLYYQSHPQIKGNLFIQNNYGIEYYYDCDAMITENKFINNSYGIVFNTSSHYCETFISKNVFAYNVNDGIHKNCNNSGDTPTITYNTIFGNGGDGIDIRKPGTEVITNNNITDNGGWGLNVTAAIETFENNNLQSNAAGEISDLGFMPSETWNFVSTNPNNNATCDIYRNINEDPMYVLSDTLDFNLQNGTLCIDGGSESVTDPDGSVSDIGRFPFEKGNPHLVMATGFGNQMVSLAWDEVNNDSLVEYNVYFKLADAEADYALFGSTADTAIDVTGLTNNMLYDFTVTGSYAAYESIFAPKVSEQPGVPELVYDPGSYSLVIPAAEDSIVENFTLTNSGSRDLHANFPGGNSNSSSAYFDGTGDYVVYGWDDRYHGMSALTLECWLYRENNGHFEFMGKNYRNYQFFIESNNYVYFYKGYGNPQSSSYQTWNTGYYINPNQWYHLAMTWEGNTLKLYVNGEHVWTATDAYSSPIPDFIGYPFELGRRAGENTYYFKGKMAEAKLWNIARTQEEIQSYLYQPPRGDEEGLMGYWPLQDDFDDHSIYGVTGTVYGETHLQSENQAPYVLYSVPQSEYTVAPGDSEIIPITFFNRNDMSSIFFTTPLSSDDFDEPEVEIEVALQFGETVPASPVHFIPVAETGLPYTIYVTDATIDGQTIDVGDEIGVFDGDLCVGAGIFDGTFNFIITAWENNPGQGLTGFASGNSMTFKMYDTSADLETNEADETYFIGDDTFGHGVFSAVALEASVYNIQNVAFTGGQFNLVSFNLLPHYPSASEVFAGIDGLEIVYIDNGGVFIPGYNINTIGDINFLDGFYLYGNNSGTIAYEGTFIHEEDWDITVEPAKWNYISMLSQDAIAVTDVFSGLEDEVSILQATSGDSWIPSQGVNTIGNLQPGQGYKIALAVDTNVTFNYPAAAKKSASIPLAERSSSSPRESVYFSPVITGLPYAVVVEIKAENESIYTLVPGDEIGLFDGGLCVGSGVYNGNNQLLITAWEQDEAQNLPGFNPGNRMHAQIYRNSHEQIQLQKLINFDGSWPTFNQGNYGHVILETNPATAETVLFSVAPNPFKNSTEVVIELQAADRINVKVFDRSGRLVKVLQEESISAGYHQINWDGTDLTGQKLNPGVYFIIAETSAKVFTEKVIILQ